MPKALGKQGLMITILQTPYGLPDSNWYIEELESRHIIGLFPHQGVGLRLRIFPALASSNEWVSTHSQCEDFAQPARFARMHAS
jgi:hypothetical protein